MAFYPPYTDADLGDPISIGWIAGGVQHHTTADSYMVNMKSTEKMARASAYIIEEIFKHTEDNIREGEIPKPYIAGTVLAIYLCSYNDIIGVNLIHIVPR